MLDGLSERLLIKDYHACYPVHDDIEMLRQAYPDIDTVKTDFILQAIYSNLDEPIPEPLNPPITNGHVKPTVNSPIIEPTRENDIPDHVREESLISEVKDIMPHLGDGFVLKCLKHYGFSAERVMNSILEDTLAEPLKETGIERLNVFDGDRFDIMTRDDVDLSNIHVGKRKEKYSLVCDEETMYSDEYDDTYDSESVAPTAADAEEVRRPFVTPRALLPRGGRGEGQEKEVLQNRDKKEKHKSTRGNHNRRQGATWKRTQGM
ncbi:putative activating signal cointegrator 1 complex subunit 2, partial [Operophtera brumata]